MRKSLGMGVVLALAFAATARPAAAQAPFDPAIDVQTFEYAVGPKTFFTVANADVADKKQLTVDALITFLTKPFSIYNVDPSMPDIVGTERTQVVTSLAAAQLSAAYGLTDKIQVGAMLPVIFQLTGDGLMPATGRRDPNGLNVTGLGDLLVEGKYLLHRERALKIGAIGGLTLPSSFGSDGSKFIGDNLPTLRARMAVQYDLNKVSFGANAGVLFRKPRTIYDSTIGQQLTWGAAAAVRVTDRFSIIGEGYGRTGLPSFSLDASPLELEGGVRIYVKPAVAVVIGGGAGLVKGIGSPEARFFVSVGYAPDVRDSDADGIPNARDKCPLIPEDLDGFQDDDGCPDDDSDGDRRPDVDDKCPMEPEDLDGFDDDDGCPEPDNDLDKILDLQDKCPVDAEDGKQPHPTDGCPASKRDSDGDGIYDDKDQCPLAEEDLDGFQDDDGCPEPDNDADGLPDAQDRCPVCAEDMDGFQDEDGCPELDNDKDGIEDKLDACPAEPETVNGFKDDDGCPDKGGPAVRLDGDRLVIDRVPTLDRRGALSTAGKKIVDQIALVMRGHDEVTKWLIALAQKKQPDAVKLADEIKARLVARGISADALQVIGAAGAPKIGGVVQERAAEDAVPAVCASTPTAAAAPQADLDVQDRDGDDVADADDKCPDQPETLNSYQDDDGCPDSIPEALKKFSGSIEGINFKSGSANILAASFKTLDSAAQAFAAYPDLKVEIQGHTDDVPPGRRGQYPDNVALSQARAEAVRDYLTTKGVDAARLQAKGYGDKKPIAAPSSLKGSALKAARTKNRRVEFKLLTK